jgi:hypothetical protein
MCNSISLHGSQEATDYLQKLLDANEITTQLVAARGMFLSGNQIPSALLRSGLEHGNRNVRIQATILSGGGLSRWNPIIDEYATRPFG